MPSPLPAQVLADLRAAVGEEHVITDPGRLLVYESDGLTSYRWPPRAVVLPADTAQVRAAVSILHEAGIAVVPRGAGTGLSGGALAAGGSVVLGTARMNRILCVDAANRVARVQPGVLNARLGAAAAPHGLQYAPDPSSQSACTLGGNVAENSGGPHCLKYGVTSRYVTGLTVVLSGGRVVELGGAGRDPALDLDLVGTFVGSEGCFGIATEIEVRLAPQPAAARTLLGIFDSVEDAARAVTLIVARGLLPAALEIMDGGSIRAVEQSAYAAGYPVDAGAALVVEFEGEDEGLDDDAARAEACCREAAAREVRRASGEAERMKLWQGRKKSFGAMGRIAPDLLVQDATVPRTRLPEVLRRVTEIGRRYDLALGNVFHAGDGNLHPLILFDRSDADQVQRVEAASREIMTACVEAGGTITGEHGVGADKRKYLPLVTGTAELAAMADVKAVFDPGGLFNPGKVLPDDVAPSADVAEAAASSAGTAEVGGRPATGTGPSRGERALTATDAVAPATAEEVAALLQDAAGDGRRVVVRGGGHALEPAARGAAVLELHTARLEGMGHYEPADLTFTARAGTRLGDLADTLAERGQFLPIDPPLAPERTLGGVVAAAETGGLQGLYGAVRDQVLGLEVVTGDGRLLRLGGRVMKNVAGFDLVRLLVGSRGTLGVITSVSLRVYPLPEVDRLVVLGAATPSALVPAARAVATAGFLPASATLTAPAPPGLDADAGAVLAVRLHGSAGAVAAQRRRLDALGVGRFRDVADGAAAAAALRDHAFGGSVVLRASAYPADLGSVLERLAGSTGWTGLAADPLSGRVRAIPAAAEAEALLALRADVGALGGSLVLLTAPAELAERVGVRGPALPDEGLVEALRRRFDPAGVLQGAFA